MHPDLEQAIGFHESIVAEGGKALVGYDTAKALANVVLMSEIPTSYDKKEQRQVNAGNLLLRGVPGVGKTFFGVILAAISNARFVRIQGRADLQPTEVVDAGVVADDRQPLGPARPKGGDQGLGDAAQPEAAHQYCRSVRDALDRLRGARQHFVHGRYSIK